MPETAPIPPSLQRKMEQFIRQGKSCRVVLHCHEGQAKTFELIECGSVKDLDG